MKNMGFYFIICLLIINLTGCSLPTAPSNLIKPPITDEANIELKMTIEKFLPPNARLTIPTNQEKVAQAFFLADVTGNGRDDVIAFYKIDNNFSLGVLVLTRNNDDKWREIGRTEEYGEEIDLIEITDITEDKLPELIVGFSSGSSLDKQLHIYSFAANNIRKIANIPYSTLTIGNIKSDSLPTLVINRNERKNDIPYTIVEFYEYRDERLDLFYTTKFEGYPGELLIGQASPDIMGLFVETYLGAHSAATHLIAYLDEQLRIVFVESDDKIAITFKPYPLPAKDVNGDGIIEIGIHQAPPDSENLAMVEIPWVESWYQWDGDQKINWIEDIYVNYRLGYEWRFPTSWKDKYTLTREEDEKTSKVDFYSLVGGKKKKQFTILSVNENESSLTENRLEDSKAEYELLGENKYTNQVFFAILAPSNPAITLEEIKREFGVKKINF